MVAMLENSPSGQAVRPLQAETPLWELWECVVCGYPCSQKTPAMVVCATREIFAGFAFEVSRARGAR